MTTTTMTDAEFWEKCDELSQRERWLRGRIREYEAERLYSLKRYNIGLATGKMDRETQERWMEVFKLDDENLRRCNVWYAEVRAEYKALRPFGRVFRKWFK